MLNTSTPLDVVKALKLALDNNTTVSVATFVELAKKFSNFRSFDGNEYAVFVTNELTPLGYDETYYAVAIAENGILNGKPEFIGSGYADVLYVAKFESKREAFELIVQTIIYDNELTGVYGSNVDADEGNAQ